MSNRRGGLGRGLGALIPTAPRAGGPAEPDGAPAGAAAHGGARGSADLATQAGGLAGSAEHAMSSSTMSSAAGTGATPGSDMVAVPGATFAEVAVADIKPNPKQPRQVFDEGALDELAHSLREVGFLQPVVVRAVDGGGYELIMGERRWRAAQQAGFDRIPAIIRDTADDAMLRDALLENLHREQLNPLEEGAAYAQLLEEFGATHDELAQRIGRSRSQVSNTIRLLNLPPSVQRKVAAGVLTAGHARALLSLEAPEAQERLAVRVVAEGLSVRAVEEIVAIGDDVGTRKRAHRAPRHHAPALDDLAAGLSDHFETRVRVDVGRAKGKITIEFASIDDLERIVGTMAPQVAAGLVAAARPADADSGAPCAARVGGQDNR